MKKPAPYRPLQHTGDMPPDGLSFDEPAGPRMTGQQFVQPRGDSDDDIDDGVHDDIYSFTEERKLSDLKLTEEHKRLIRQTFKDARNSIVRPWPQKDPMLDHINRLEQLMLTSTSLADATMALKKALSQPGTWLIPRPFDNFLNYGRHMAKQDRDRRKSSAYDHLRSLHEKLDDLIYYETGYIRKKRVFKGVPFGTIPTDRKKGRGILFKDYQTQSPSTFEAARECLESIGAVLQYAWPMYPAGMPLTQPTWHEGLSNTPRVPVTPYEQIQIKKENNYVDRDQIYQEVIKNKELERGIINFCYRGKRRGGGADAKINLVGLVDLCGAKGLGKVLSNLLSANVGGSVTRLQGIADAIYTEVTEKTERSQTILYGQMSGYSVEWNGSVAIEVSFTPLKALNTLGKLEKYPSILASVKASIGVGAGWNGNWTSSLYVLKNPAYTDRYDKLASTVADYIPFTTHEKATRYSRVALGQIEKSINKAHDQSFDPFHQYQTMSLSDIKNKCEGHKNTNTKAKALYDSIDAFQNTREDPDKFFKTADRANAGIAETNIKNILWIQHTVHKVNGSVDVKLGIDPKYQHPTSGNTSALKSGGKKIPAIGGKYTNIDFMVLGACYLRRKLAYILQTKTTPNPPNGGLNQRVDTQWKLQATIIESKCWTLEALKSKTQLSLTQQDRPAFRQKKSLLIHKFESVIAYFSDNNQSRDKVFLRPGSGRVFGHTYLHNEIERLLNDNQDLAVRETIASCLHIDKQHLNAFLEGLKEGNLLSHKDVMSREAVILEATYKLINLTTTTLDLNNTDPQYIKNAFPEFNRENYRLQAIRLRIGVTGTSQYADKNNMRAGVFAGPIEIGLRYEETVEAGIDYVNDIHTYWNPEYDRQNNYHVPPAFLLCT